jgi:hypothetical protein
MCLRAAHCSANLYTISERYGLFLVAMAYILKNGAVFLHIPKTGGTWVRNVLSQCNLISHSVGHKHSDFDRTFYEAALLNESNRQTSLLDAMRSANAACASRPFTFCFVRNPLSWYESWWHYMRAREWHAWGTEHWHPNAELNGLGHDDFNEFVMNVVRRYPGYVSNLYRSYAKGDISYVGKTENLRSDLRSVLKAIGYADNDKAIESVPAANTAPASVTQARWDPSVKSLVRTLELPALLRFGYSTPEEARLFGYSSATGTVF